MFIKEFFSGNLFFSGEGVKLSNFRDEGLFKVNCVIIRARRGKFSSIRFFKDLGKLGIFWGKDGFRFGEFHLYGQFSGIGDLATMVFGTK